MLAADLGTEKPILTNEYFSDSYIKNQIMGDGRRFGYAYFRGERNLILENQITDLTDWRPIVFNMYREATFNGYRLVSPTNLPVNCLLS